MWTKKIPWFCDLLSSSLPLLLGQAILHCIDKTHVYAYLTYVILPSASQYMYNFLGLRWTKISCACPIIIAVLHC